MPLCTLISEYSTSENLKWASRRSALIDVVYIINIMHCDVTKNAHASNVIHHVIHVVDSRHPLRYTS